MSDIKKTLHCAQKNNVLKINDSVVKENNKLKKYFENIKQRYQQYQKQQQEYFDKERKYFSIVAHRCQSKKIKITKIKKINR